jgi:hypothetical protein
MADKIIKYFVNDTLVFDVIAVPFKANSDAAGEDFLPINDVTVTQITENSATINWSTARGTTAIVSFLDNVCPIDGCQITVDEYKAQHSVTVTGLLPNTKYKFFIKGQTKGLVNFQSIETSFNTIRSVVIPTPSIELPKIVNGLASSYTWNIEKDNSFTITFNVNETTDYVKYYYPNQPNSDENYGIRVQVPADNKKVTIKLENPGIVGIYDLTLIPGNNTIKDGEERTVQINVVKEFYYGEPDVTEIFYNKTIKEADLKPLDFYFDFNIRSVNSEGINVYLGNDVATPITVLSTNDNKSSLNLYAKDLYQLYKERFNETQDTYTLTFSFHPFFNGVTGKIFGRLEPITVTVTKTKYILTKNEVLDALSSAFKDLFSGDSTKKDYEDKIIFEDDKYLYYRIKYQNSPFDSFVINNIAEDTITYSLTGSSDPKVVKTEFIVNPITGNTERKQKTPYSTLVLRLLEPLPAEIVENTQVWIAKQIIPTVVEDIVITDDDDNICTPLRPNFSIDVLEDSGYEYLEQIVASGSLTSANIVNKYLGKNEFSLEDLNITYTSGSNVTGSEFIVFKNFVNYSSAKTRIENYQYKLETIEFWENKIFTTTYSASIASTSSFAMATSQSYLDKIQTLKNGFDGFEKTLYDDYSITGSNNTFFEVQSFYAEEYDKYNKNYLVNHLPEYLKVGEIGQNSEEFLVFVQMIGNHFDIIWSYINGINRTKRITHTSENGIADKFLHTMLESMGWDPKSPFNGLQLWKEAFGLNQDGSTPTNSNVLGVNIPSTYTPFEAKNEVWRRILNNLPYLLKYKGTRRAINAILACYGVPASLLTVVEFGGPSPNPENLYKFTYEDRSAALNLSTSEYVALPWLSGSYNPNSVQIRFATDYKPTTASTGSQLLRMIGGGSNYWKINLIPTYTGSYGNVLFEIGNGVTTGSILITGSVLFDDYYKNITLQQETVTSASVDYDRFTLYVKEALDDRIIMNQSGSLYLPTNTSLPNVFNGAGVLYIGSDTTGRAGISGSVDEFRLWKTALSESAITSHALNPDVIYGNNIYSTTEDLFVRLDFEYVKERISDPYIKNVSPAIIYTDATASNGTYLYSKGYTGYATASVNTIATDYPYQYEVYTRMVSAEMPSIGFVGQDKVRLEDIELVSPLSYRQRSTVKSLDRAPADSNKLGLFFSPTKELNLDILKSLGSINIGDYIGDWQDEYGTDRYADLDVLRNYYFQRINLNIDEYIRLIKSIDKSLFDMLYQVIPERANVVSGILLEPSLLERSKIKINKPTANNIYHTASINLNNNAIIEASIDTINATVDTNVSKDLVGTNDTYETLIVLDDTFEIESTTIYYTSSISLIDTSFINGEVSTIEAYIDAGLYEPTILTQHQQESSYQSAGNDKDSPSESGFGIMGENGAVDRTYFDNSGFLVLSERMNGYILTIKYTRKVPDTDLNGNTVYENVATFSKKLVLVDPIDPLALNVFKSPKQHSFYTNILAALGTYPYDNGVVTAIEVFNGYTTGHYRYTKDTTKGMENSFYNGSKQTSRTTLDNAPAVEVFSTNPNRLKVTDTGRGSGEPILEVD